MSEGKELFMERHVWSQLFSGSAVDTLFMTHFFTLSAVNQNEHILSLIYYGLQLTV